LWNKPLNRDDYITSEPEEQMTFKSCLSWLFFFNFLLSGWQLVLRDFFLHPFLFLFVGFEEKKGENAEPMFRLFVATP
jgi:hypothetical protein